MDLLDTPGDWVQLTGCIAGMYFIPPLITEALKNTKAPQIALAAVASYLASVTVYDYDLILGYLLGSIFGAWAQRSSKMVDSRTGDQNVEPKTKQSTWINFGVGLVMIWKIFLNFF